MALAKQNDRRPGFGQRDNVAPRVRVPAPRTSAAATAAPAGALAATVTRRPSSLDSVSRDVSTAASRGRAYAIACLAGVTTFLAVLFVLTGVESRFFQSGFMLAVLAVPVLPTLALALYIPTVVLSDIARLLSVPRGWADIGVGLVLGLGLAVAIVQSNADQRSLPTAVAALAGGLMGGFAFWRAQGYPGSSKATAAAMDRAYEKLG